VKTIERKMKALGERLERLEQLCREFSSFNEYQASLDAKDIAERNLQVAIEACLDIGKIIISAKKLNEPKDNKGIFVVLAEGGIISHKSLDFLLPMAGARNILVHGYDKVDDGLIYGVIKSHLDDFAKFLREIKENYLKSSVKEEK
jgi:uncharacterized protein YutE (UPF0331/DUF86 family)